MGNDEQLGEQAEYQIVAWPTSVEIERGHKQLLGTRSHANLVHDRTNVHASGNRWNAEGGEGEEVRCFGALRN